MTLPIIYQTFNGCAAAVTAAVLAERTHFSDHAKERMAERGVTLDDIAHALKNGHCSYKGPGQLSYGSQCGEVIVSVNEDGSICIVTVWDRDPPKLRVAPDKVRKKKGQFYCSDAYRNSKKTNELATQY